MISMDKKWINIASTRFIAITLIKKVDRLEAQRFKYFEYHFTSHQVLHKLSVSMSYYYTQLSIEIAES